MAEILVAVLLMGIVMTAIMTGVLSSLSLWARGDTEAEIESNGRLILEQIARGRYGMYGLKEANLDALTISQQGSAIEFYIDKNDPPTPKTTDDTGCRYYLIQNKVYYDPDISVSGNETPITSHGRVESLVFTKTGGFISIDLTVKDTPPASDKPIETKLSTGVFLRKSRIKLY